MTALLLLLVALAFGDELKLPPTLKTATPEQQKEIVDAAKAALDARAESIKYFVFVEALKEGQPRAAQALNKLGMARQEQFEQQSELALKKTVEYYGIKPAGLDWGGSMPAKQGPRLGDAITWQPKVVASDRHYFTYKDASGNTRYAGAFLNPQRDGGMTWSDGSVTIFVSMLQEAVDYGAGRLASITFHESIHVHEQMTRTEDTKQAGEIRAYELNKLAAPVFQLPEYMVRKFDKEIARNQDILNRGQGSSKYLNREQERKVKEQYEREQRRQAEVAREEAELQRRATEDEHIAWIDSLCAFACDNTLSRLEPPLYRSPERYVREARDRRALPSRSPSCSEKLCLQIFDHLAGGGTLDKEWVNRASDGIKLAALQEGFWRDAVACGFKPVMTGDGISGFQAEMENGSTLSYTFASSRLTAQAVRAKFVQARACLDSILNPKLVSKWGYDPECVKGLPPNALAESPELNVDDKDQSHCLVYTLPGFAGNEKSFLKAVRKTSKKWKGWLKERERVRRHNEWVERENQRRREQQNDDSGGNDDDDNDSGGCSEPNPDTGIVGCPG